MKSFFPKYLVVPFFLKSTLPPCLTKDLCTIGTQFDHPPVAAVRHIDCAVGCQCQPHGLTELLRPRALGAARHHGGLAAAADQGLAFQEVRDLGQEHRSLENRKQKNPENSEFIVEQMGKIHKIDEKSCQVDFLNNDMKTKKQPITSLHKLS